MKKVLSLIGVAILFCSALCAQNSAAAASERKVYTRVAPAYPELAKKMHLQGVVKIEAVVRPNGSVKSTRVLGGNPVLIDAASDAVSKWKFEPGQAETTEVVQLTFLPQQ
ncbi:MAG TPA: energy transducer TonB [Candidatus Solibacter sp.]|nr:energy transducer TonB [Candidatus Solibacter sp.]